MPWVARSLSKVPSRVILRPFQGSRSRTSLAALGPEAGASAGAAAGTAGGALGPGS